MMLINSFPPIVSKNCTTLFLGTMPGKISLRKKEYYGHGGNRFWEVMSKTYGINKNDSYETRCSKLLVNKLALWDVIESCERNGSSDKKIKNPIANKFSMFFEEYSNINHIILNGNPPYEFYQELVGDDFGRKISISLTTSPWSRIHYSDSDYFSSWKKILINGK